MSMTAVVPAIGESLSHSASAYKQGLYFLALNMGRQGRGRSQKGPPTP